MPNIVKTTSYPINNNLVNLSFFYLDRDPVKSAEYLCDEDLVTALSTIFHLSPTFLSLFPRHNRNSLRVTHSNEDEVRKLNSNFIQSFFTTKGTARWLRDWVEALKTEFLHRFNFSNESFFKTFGYDYNNLMSYLNHIVSSSSSGTTFRRKRFVTPMTPVPGHFKVNSQNERHLTDVSTVLSNRNFYSHRITSASSYTNRQRPAWLHPYFF